MEFKNSDDWNSLLKCLRNAMSATSVKVRDRELDKACFFAEKIDEAMPKGDGSTNTTFYLSEALDLLSKNRTWNLPL